MTPVGRVIPLNGADDGLATARLDDAVLSPLHAPPSSPITDVRLPRLAPLLKPADGERVVQVYGPTGLGKTTLLASLARAEPQQWRWLNLQAAHLADAAALRKALAEALHCALADQASFQGLNAQLPPGGITAVIDAGALELGPAGEILAELVAWTDARLTLCLISRRAQTAMLAQLRSPHLVHTLDPALLLFTGGEIETSGLSGGWPLGHAVALAAGGDDAGPDRLLDHGGGLLEAAIDGAIWRHLSPAAQTLVATTAMLDRVDGRLAARIAAPSLAYPLLDEIAALAPLGSVERGAGGGFSIHPLLRAFALRQLERGSPSGRDEAYRQALLHHAERRAPDAAMALVQHTGDLGLARMAFEAFTSAELLGASGYNRVRSAMEHLLPEEAEQSSQIRITQAIVAIKEGRFPEARRLLDAVRSMLNEDTAYQSHSGSRVYADFVIAQHVLAFHAHAELTEAQLAEGAFWSTYTNDLTNAAFVCALRSLHYLRRGEIALAQEQIEIARDKYERATNYYGLGSALLVDGMIALAAGRLGRAATLAREARVLISRAMPDEAGLLAVAECVLCEVEFERGHAEALFDRVDAALRDLEACDGWPDAFVIGYRVGARAAQAAGDTARAQGLLDRAIRLMRGRGLADIERYCRLLRDGPATEGQVAPAARFGWRESDEGALAAGHSAMAVGDYPAAMAIADALHGEATASGRRITAIRALLLQAAHDHHVGDGPGSVRAFETAVTLAEAEGIVQPFVEFGPVLLLVMEAMKAQAAYRTAGRATRSFCAALARAIALRCQDAGAGAAFVPRELQVLQGLARRLSNKEIARELQLSASAVKFHLSNIYRKLGVNKRSEAAVEAQRRGVGS